MKNNEQLQLDVQEAIKWELLLNPGEIGVSADGGVVTLTGVVDSYLKKSEAEEAAKNVSGVMAVVEKIEVQFSIDRPEKPDDEIASEAIRALQLNGEIPYGNIRVSVNNGWITLEGELQRNYQRRSARDSVKHLPGVRGVSNHISIVKGTEDKVEKTAIENALKRNSALDKLHIKVEVSGEKVILSGSVNSLYQKAEAERIALNAPGVNNIVNNLVVADTPTALS